jgi:hypothetical protein
MASHAAVFWQLAAKDCGSVVAERVARHVRQLIERSEAIQGGGVSAGRPVEARNRSIQSVELRNEPRLPPNCGQGDLILIRQGRLLYGLSKIKL